MSSSQIVQKLWNYCHVLRDDGMSALRAMADRLEHSEVVPEDLLNVSFIAA